MKIYILTDLEGPCLVNRWEQTRVVEATPLKQQAMTRLTREVNATVDGILSVDAGAEVVVWDGHGSGGIDVLQFTPKAWLVAHGKGARAPYQLDESFDGLMFVGQHAMAGTAAAPLCHTYSSRTVEYYRLNGADIGEFGCRAAMAGLFGVPTIFISGDDKATAEARLLVPDIVCVDTKLGLGVELAQHRPVAAVEQDLFARAAEACRRRQDLAPYVIDGPYHMESRVLEGCSPDGYLKRDARVKQLDDRTVEFTTDDLLELWI